MIFWRSQTSSLSNEEWDEHSLSELAAIHQVDRRSNIRVKYPKNGGVGHLPQVKYQGEPVRLKNVSTGGLCIIDEKDAFGQQVGSEIPLTLIWPQHQSQIKAKIVGVNLSLRHIQFLEVDDHSRAIINRIVTPGYIAEKMRRVRHEDSHLKLSVEELWLGFAGEKITFLRTPQGNKTSGEPFAEVTLLGINCQVWKDGRIEMQSILKRPIMPTVGRRIRDDILVMLSNLKEDSPRVENLIHYLCKPVKKA